MWKPPGSLPAPQGGKGREWRGIEASSVAPQNGVQHRAERARADADFDVEKEKREEEKRPDAHAVASVSLGAETGRRENQRLSGAEMLRRWSAARWAMNLCAGSLPRARQFVTTLGRVSPSAVAALVGPPRAAISSSRVLHVFIMRRIYTHGANSARGKMCMAIATHNAHSLAMREWDTSLEAIGKRIEATRLALGYTNASAFARLVGISVPALGNYERGERRPNVDQALQIVRATGATLDWIYRGDRSGLPHRIAAHLPAEPSEAGFPAVQPR